MLIMVCDRRDVATFVNSYPTLDVSYELVKGDYTAGSPIVVKISLSRDTEEDEDEEEQEGKLDKKALADMEG